MSLFLVLVLAVQTAVCAVGESEEAPQTYTGKFLAAINTNYAEEDGGGQFSAELQEGEEVSGAQAVLQRLWAQVEPMTPQEALRAEQAEAETVEAQGVLRPYRVGDVKIVPDSASMIAGIANSSTEKDILASLMPKKMLITCRYTDDVCTIWTSKDCDWSSEQIRQLAQNTGRLIPQLEDLFGTPRIDTDGDGKIALFVHDMPKGGAAYFNPFDIIDKSGRIGGVKLKTAGIDRLFGAACDCLHVGYMCPMEDITTIFVHEYQHYIHASYLYEGKTNDDYLTRDPLFIDEGFSSASQMILDISDFYYSEFIDGFNGADPARHSLTDWVQATGRYDDSLASYGLSFAFFQYIRTRYAALIGDKRPDFPGRGIYKLVLQSRNRSNQDNTLGIIADILYPADKYPALADTDARIRELITDFWLAVFCCAPEGEHGFNGEGWAYSLHPQVREDIGGAQTIRNAMGQLYCLKDGAEASVTIGDAGDGLRFVPVEQAYTLTFDPNGGFGDPVRIHTTQSVFILGDDAIPVPYRDGFVCTGWADASGSEYSEMEPNIPLTGDKTLYAVWSAADQVKENEPNPARIFTDVHVQFRPAEDGVYYIDSTTSYNAVVFNPELGMRCAVSSPEEGMYLLAGRTYTMKGFFVTDVGQQDTYTFRRRTAYYDVRYYPDADATSPLLTQQYGTTYTVADCTEEKWGGTFLGWSTQKDADEAAYAPGDLLTVDRDTALYAVWKPWNTIKQNTAYTKKTGSEYYVFFTPEKTASYKIQLRGRDAGITVFDETGTQLYKWFDNDASYTLYADKTYCLGVAGMEGTAYAVQYDSASTEHTVKLKVDLSMMLLNVKVRPCTEFVLPDYRPIYFGGETFLYWEDRETGAHLQPGDTVYVGDHDVILKAQNEMRPGFPEAESDVSKLGTIVIDLIAWLIGCIPRYVPLWFRSFTQRIRLFGFKGFRI